MKPRNSEKTRTAQRSTVVLVAGMVLLLVGSLAAQPIRIGFIAAEASLEQMGPDNRAAWDAATALGQATLLLRQPDGSFADRSGQTWPLKDFDVLWYHQGDAIRRTAMYGGDSLEQMRRFAHDGHGVLLSGGALALVASLSLETEIRPQRHELEDYREPAGMIPVESAHPIFSGLPTDGRTIWLSRGGCGAVADFYWGGPAEGMVLAKTPVGPENPLVEYTLGSGRVIVFGWRWPDYADSQSPHRSHLIRLTSNLLQYLAQPDRWRPVVIRSAYPPAASPDQPGVSDPQWRALRMAIEDLSASFPDRYAGGRGYLERLNSLQAEQNRLPLGGDRTAYELVLKRFEALRREALLANPLLDFDQLLMIRRRADRLGLPLNFHGNTDIEPTGYDNTLVGLSPVRPDGELSTLFRPEGDRFVGDIDLDYDAQHLLMSIPDANGRWGIAELDLNCGRLTSLPLIDEPDVHNYDACYLPDGRIVFTSTAPFIGVPCVGGRSMVANLYLKERDGCIRRLTNDQDHNWCPTVLNNGRLLYQRWEYADIAHAFTRLLFHANPDGTQQMEYYGSNSFWPTAIFFARPIPNHPSKVVAVVGGHHDAPRQGELVVLDPQQGRHETSGVVQRIPGFGKKVEPVVLDGLIGNSWPRFLHPYPLSEKYFLVSCRPTKTSLWGVYLVDVFDNFVLLHEEPGWAMLEPIPLRKTTRPPVLADQFQAKQTEATVLLVDVYRGAGLQGVPRGTVKRLRLIGYEYTFHGMGGEPDRVGFDGPWDVKRILGTVPVEADGSAYFRVPACTPIAVQPLDGQGKALALMRSWFTAMPGEIVSCVGCHEPQNTTPPAPSTLLAVRRDPCDVQPWYGPPRGFSFTREVQPVLDAYCVRCHDGQPVGDGPPTLDLTARTAQRVESAFQMYFTPSYMTLHRFVHTPTLESDAHLLPPRDFHADTSKLVQILRDGHYAVELSAEAWDRLITWIDLNAPAHGTWREVVGHIPGKSELVERGAARRRELLRRYAGIDEDPEAVYPPASLAAPPTREQARVTPQPSLPELVAERGLASVGTSGGLGPASAEPNSPTSLARTPVEQPSPESRPNVGQLLRDPHSRSPKDRPTLRQVELAPGVTLPLVYIHPGRFVMGSDQGYPNELPAHSVTLDEGFWIGQFEITNGQYACFDPTHDSGLETGEQYQFGDYERGHLLRRPEQPVVRVSWTQAMAFCRWLSNKTGGQFSLPTEAQWEYACRAGTRGPLWYGGLDDDFSAVANLSDATHYTVDYPHVPDAIPPWRPADPRFDDHWRVSAPVGTFQPNPWGLFDMHGNVSEWTRSTYRPYTDQAAETRYADGTNAAEPTDELNETDEPDSTPRKTVRGGSWLDRPRRARSAFRLHYDASQAVHDVGFRVLCQKN